MKVLLFHFIDIPLQSSCKYQVFVGSTPMKK